MQGTFSFKFLGVGNGIKMENLDHRTNHGRNFGFSFVFILIHPSSISHHFILLACGLSQFRCHSRLFRKSRVFVRLYCPILSISFIFSFLLLCGRSTFDIVTGQEQSSFRKKFIYIF